MYGEWLYGRYVESFGKYGVVYCLIHLSYVVLALHNYRNRGVDKDISTSLNGYVLNYAFVVFFSTLRKYCFTLCSCLMIRSPAIF